MHGKNLFYFFGNEADPVVMHFHFGMSGAFRTMSLPGPEPTETTRLQVGVLLALPPCAHLHAAVRHSTSLQENS